ncbi:TSUP family transporter [Marinomonas gallaica]|uniref:TSUP family transporter n=1 Tax=Marinomonas gallaica TaxID=1806667 RepID=UPI0009EF1B96|nr:TSUP family transporter [Marinomonas gallaica]
MLPFSVFAYCAIDLLSLTIVILGIIVQARIGIGFALLSAPLLFIINENYMPGPILILGFILSLLLFFSEKQSLSLKLVLPALAARFPGSWFGVVILVYLPQWLLGLAIGVSLLFASLLAFIKFSISLNARNLFLAGFFSGFSGTITSIGGPIMALIYQNETPVNTRKALITFFLIGTPTSIFLLVLAGELSQQAFVLSVKMLPGVLIGFLLSRYRLFVVISPSKKIIISLSVFSALIIIGKSLLML